MGSRQAFRVAINTKAWAPTEREWLSAAQSIQRAEKDRIGRFIFKRDAKLSMVGRLLIRAVLADMTGMPSADLQLGRTEKGKPYLVDVPSFQGSFNVSHQGDYAVIAADSCNSVGADIMKIEHRKDLAKFFLTMRRQLTDEEWGTVEAQPGDPGRLAMFYRLWCLKESYVKAVGTGIGFEMGRLNFHIETETFSTNQTVSDTVVEVDGHQQNDWLFEEAMLDQDHCVAIATRFSFGNRQSPEQYQPSLFQLWGIRALLEKCQPLHGHDPDPEYWRAFSGKQESPTTRPS